MLPFSVNKLIQMSMLFVLGIFLAFVGERGRVLLKSSMLMNLKINLILYNFCVFVVDISVLWSVCFIHVSGAYTYVSLSVHIRMESRWGRQIFSLLLASPFPLRPLEPSFRLYARLSAQWSIYPYRHRLVVLMDSTQNFMILDKSLFLLISSAGFGKSSVGWQFIQSRKVWFYFLRQLKTFF